LCLILLEFQEVTEVAVEKADQKEVAGRAMCKMVKVDQLETEGKEKSRKLLLA
jgi:hypothetical protein